MTDSTTNEQIALELGWKTGDVRTADGGTNIRWYAPGENHLQQYHLDPPDYEHDWKHVGPLLEEMIEKALASPDRHLEGGWCLCWERESPFKGYIIRGDTLTEAISRAWLAWKKGE